jgi:N-acetylgalactosamine-N,N'-diacetylbacillosaminyl-diphospho-undecaprenol 4-alpha-N-acetylgalactosaminyltransferase
MAANKKIAIFIVSLFGGGAERVVSILLKHLPAHLDIHLVLLHNAIEYEIPAGQKVHYLTKSNSGKPVLNILKIPLLAWRYKRFLKKNDIHTSFSFLPRPNFIALFTRLLGYRGRLIISERQYTSYHYKQNTLAAKTGGLLVKWLYPKADTIVCNSQAIVADLQQNFGVQSQFAVVHNPVDLALIDQQRATAPGPGPVFTFITIGRLSREKNHALILKACALLPPMDYRVQIVGKGPLEEELLGNIHALELQARVSLEPHTQNPFAMMGGAHCFILSSDTEGFPNALLEAMACGLPVIATDCKAGPSDLLRPGAEASDTVDSLTKCPYGILVPPGNEKMLAQAMQLMMDDAELRHHYAQKSKIRSSDFAVEKIVKAFTAILEQ